MLSVDILLECLQNREVVKTFLSVDANGVVVTDVLPEGFVISSITAQTNGVTTTYESDEYSVDTSTNTLTLPVGAGPEIIVPAATSTETGLTVITITGIIN